MVVDSGVLEGGGCWVMYTIENNLLHLHLGLPPQSGFLPPQSGQQNPDWGGGFF